MTIPLTDDVPPVDMTGEPAPPEPKRRMPFRAAALETCKTLFGTLFSPLVVGGMAAILASYHYGHLAAAVTPGILTLAAAACVAAERVAKTKIIPNIIGSPAVLWGAAGTLSAYVYGEALGAIVPGALTLFTAGCVAFERITKKEVGLPYLSQAFCAALTGVLILSDEGIKHGFEHLIAASPKTCFVAAGAEIGAVGYLVAAWKERTSKQSRFVFDDEMLYYSLSDMACVLANGVKKAIFEVSGEAQIAASFMLASVVKVVFDRAPPEQFSHRVFERMAHVITPERLCAVGYTLGAGIAFNDSLILALHNGLASTAHGGQAAFGLAQVLWAAGFLKRDYDKKSKRPSDIPAVEKDKPRPA